MRPRKMSWFDSWCFLTIKRNKNKIKLSNKSTDHYVDPEHEKNQMKMSRHDELGDDVAYKCLETFFYFLAGTDVSLVFDFFLNDSSTDEKGWRGE